MKELQIVYKNISELNPYKNNPRFNDEAVEAVANSIKQFGFKVPIIIDSSNVIVAGHTRLKAAKQLGMDKVPCIIADDLTEEQIRAFRLVDNKVSELADWDYEKLEEELANINSIDMNIFDFDMSEINDIVEHLDEDIVCDSELEKVSLSEKFLFTPTSVLNTRCAQWQERKRAWFKYGIKSDLSRENIKTTGSAAGSVPRFYQYKEDCEKELGHKLSVAEFTDNYLHRYMKEDSLLKFTNTGGILSVFDPVLCELMYYWFSFDKAKILDPFAGGSVRGIIASKLNRQYTGVDLRKEQIEANINQGDELLSTDDIKPKWICGNSLNISSLAKDEYDFIFSCPPYYDLEIYSDDKEDLSNQTYEDFLSMYRKIIFDSVNMLKDNRFACFVVGDIRNRKTGMYRNFVSETIAAFHNAGMELYNEIILLTTLGSLPIRMGRGFSISRKVGKTHQNVLVFYKGDQKKIRDLYGDIDILEISSEDLDI